tara:strand:- start:4017 stop:4568 length:552 start_codon:yes stop_codon:yes gene_type:complete
LKYTKDFIDTFKNGNVESFNQVFKDFIDPLYQFCYFRLNSKEDAEDLVEEIFTKIFKNMCNFDDSKSSIKTWIYSIARNSLIDFIRTKKDQNLELTDHIEDDQININLEANLAMNAQTLKLAFQKLNESERQLVEMRFISDMSYDEISQVMGKNSGALRVSMTRTLSKLKQIFKDMGISESNI